MAEFDAASFGLEELPYSLEAEQSVLGSLLIDPECITLVLEHITKPEMFFRKQHMELFEVFLNMFNFSKTVDFITVLDEVNKASISRMRGRQRLIWYS